MPANPTDQLGGQARLRADLAAHLTAWQCTSWPTCWTSRPFHPVAVGRIPIQTQTCVR
jgi:hypothetical protein